MERFTLAQAAAWTNARLSGDAVLTSVSTDSRKITAGALFLPIRGDRFDGHDFIGTAIENGAQAVVSQRQQETYPVPALYTEDTGQALLDLAGGYRRLCGNSRVVAVTGSVGKTTTKELMYAALCRGFRAQKTEGNLNNEIGLPLTLFRLTRDTEVMVAEMGMNHFGEISRMTRAAQPDIAVITNIGTSHIEFLGSREGICRAKLEIMEGIQPGGCAVFCGDEPLLWAKRDSFRHPVYTYGLQSPACHLTARCGADGTFEIVNNSLPGTKLPTGGCFTAKLQLPGEHNTGNALAAALVALLLGEEPAAIAAGLAAYQASGLRQHIYDWNGYRLFADCYNASPDAMEATLKVLGRMNQTGRRFAVLGSMLELGAYAEEGHRLTGRAAAENADALYAYGPDAAAIVAGAKERGMVNAFAFDSHTALADALRQAAKPGDALLFKGSRAMKMEHVLKLFQGEDVEE